MHAGVGVSQIASHDDIHQFTAEEFLSLYYIHGKDTKDTNEIILRHPSKWCRLGLQAKDRESPELWHLEGPVHAETLV